MLRPDAATGKRIPDGAPRAGSGLPAPPPSAMKAQESGAVTLVVRLWFEGSQTKPAGGEWRGEVKQVPSGRVFYFRGLDGLVERVRLLIQEEEA